MISPDERLWVAAIAADPADMTVRGVYADWLEEHGRERAASFWRWASDKGLLPYRGHNRDWSWWDKETYPDEDFIGTIPRPVFESLKGGEVGQVNHSVRRYAADAERLCWLDLAAAADAHREDAHV